MVGPSIAQYRDSIAADRASAMLRWVRRGAISSGGFLIRARKSIVIKRSLISVKLALHDVCPSATLVGDFISHNPTAEFASS